MSDPPLVDVLQMTEQDLELTAQAKYKQTPSAVFALVDTADSLCHCMVLERTLSPSNGDTLLYLCAEMLKNST